jgi:uncharacterized protein involved in type VI secretion and phage assembly
VRALREPAHLRDGVGAPVFPGVYAGHVTDVSDSTKLGRVKVSVPAVYGDDGPEYDAWARPSFPYGHFFVPKVGDRVWVAFEDGDPAAPVWLGVWYPTGQAPQDAAGATPPRKRLVQTESGHQVLLDDTTGAEKVLVKSKGGHQVLLDDTSGSAKVLVQDASGSKVELAATTVTVHAAHPLTIEAPGQAITIKAASVDVQSG